MDFSVLNENEYPGRGIAIGMTKDARHAILAYFIMGRSVNSRNRLFEADGDGIRTKAVDEAKLSDPSLIIYSPVRVLKDCTIVTNGDQTDTIYECMSQGGSFEDALLTRQFEPDAPNFTPRISGILKLKDGGFSYKLSILKKQGACVRYYYHYDTPIAGEGRLIHTYLKDGSPIPPFEGEPKKVEFDDGIDHITDELWNALDEKNKVSLFVRKISLSDQSFETRIVNKYA